MDDQAIKSVLRTAPVLDHIDFIEASYTSHEFPRHMHDTYVIQVVEKGVNDFFCKGKTHRAPAGSIILINPEEVHTGNSWQGQYLQYRCFYPTLGLFSKQMEESGGSGVPYFRENVIRDPQLAAGILDLHRAITQADALQTGIQYYRVFDRLLTQYAEKRPSLPSVKKEPYKIRQAMHFLEANLAGKFSLHELAASACLSPYHFLRVFSRETGMTPLQYLINLRIEKARELLRRQVPILDVSFLTGFSDQSHFTRNFKKLVGVTPLQYRKG